MRTGNAPQLVALIPQQEECTADDAQVCAHWGCQGLGGEGVLQTRHGTG